MSPQVMLARIGAMDRKQLLPLPFLSFHLWLTYFLLGCHSHYLTQLLKTGRF